MLGYTEKDVVEMIYGIQSARLIINSDENPAIDRYLFNSADFLEGILAEGRI